MAIAAERHMNVKISYSNSSKCIGSVHEAFQRLMVMYSVAQQRERQVLTFSTRMKQLWGETDAKVELLEQAISLIESVPSPPAASYRSVAGMIKCQEVTYRLPRDDLHAPGLVPASNYPRFTFSSGESTKAPTKFRSYGAEIDDSIKRWT